MHRETSHPAEIAIIDPNTLATMGLQDLLEQLLPEAVIRTFNSFAALMDDTPYMYAHYFVSAQIYFEHTAFFIEQKYRTIVLAGGDPLPQLAGMRTLNINQPEAGLVRQILHLHHAGHGHGHGPGPVHRLALPPIPNHDLSAREIEVLVLLTKGLINKEIADRLGISLTTVISHRKNITEKLGIKSTPALAIYAVMHGYVSVDEV